MKKYLNSKFDYRILADTLDELSLWSAPFGLKLLDMIDYKPNISAIDIGFGTGFPLTELSMRLGEGSVVYGIDPWVEAIEKVKQKIGYYGITNVELIEGCAESIPLDAQTIDLITSNNGLNNVADLDKALSECSRISRKGAQFIQTMNLDLSMFEFYDVLESVLSEYGMFDKIDEMRAHIAQKRPSAEHVKALVKKHGFVIKDMVYDQFCYRFASGTALLNHYFIRLAFMNSWIALLPEDKTEEIFGLIEERLNEQAKQQGTITLSIPFLLLNAIKA